MVGFSGARLQVKTFTTVAADKKPVAFLFIRAIISIGNTDISTQSITTSHARHPDASIVVALDAAILKSRVNLAEEVMAHAGAASVGVSATVANDVRAEPKALPALGAHVGLFPRVHPPVVHQIGVVGEPLATLHTTIGFLTRVGTPVISQRGTPRKALPAFLALVRFLSGVSPLMASKA